MNIDFNSSNANRNSNGMNGRTNGMNANGNGMNGNGMNANGMNGNGMNANGMNGNGMNANGMNSNGNTNKNSTIIQDNMGYIDCGPNGTFDTNSQSCQCNAGFYGSACDMKSCSEQTSFVDISVLESLVRKWMKNGKQIKDTKIIADYPYMKIAKVRFFNSKDCYTFTFIHDPDCGKGSGRYKAGNSNSRVENCSCWKIASMQKSCQDIPDIPSNAHEMHQLGKQNQNVKRSIKGNFYKVA